MAVTASGASATGVTPELAFVADGDIWVMNADGTTAPVRLAVPGDDRAPAWSPVGGRIAFESVRRLSVMNADGSGLRTIEDGNAVSLAWSRDGRRIAFTRQGQGPGVELRVADPDGSGSTRLATVVGGTVPSWTATNRVVAAVLEGGTTGVIRSIDPATGASFRIDDGLAPSVSPDGARVAYVRLGAQKPALYVASVDGSGARRVSQRPASQETPAWSPDGTEIAFIGLHGGYAAGVRGGWYPTDYHRDLYVVDVATGVTQRVTGHPEEPAPIGAPDAAAPSWWPDGSRLFVTFGIPSVVNVDGSCAQPFQPVERASQFTWRPGAALDLPDRRCADLWSRFEPYPEVVGRGADLMIVFSVTNVGNEPAPTQIRVDGMRNGVLREWSVPAAVCGRAAVCELGTIEPDEVVRVAVVVRAGSPGVLDMTVRASTPADPAPWNDGQRTPALVSTCRLVGTSGADELVGTSRADSICGLTGADRIEGGKGNDLLDGGGGTDTILGGDGRDRVEGRGGRDVIVVRDGLRDVVACGTERDTVVADRRDVVARDCERVLRR